MSPSIVSGKRATEYLYEPFVIVKRILIPASDSWRDWMIYADERRHDGRLDYVSAEHPLAAKYVFKAISSCMELPVIR